MSNNNRDNRNNNNNNNRAQARELLQSVGQNLGPREAARIAEKTNLSVQQVASIADNRGISTNRAVPAQVQTTAPSSAPSGAPSAPAGTTYASSYSNSNNPARNYTIYSSAPLPSSAAGPVNGRPPEAAPPPKQEVDYNQLFNSWANTFGQLTATSRAPERSQEIDSLRSELSAVKAEREDAKARAQEYERQREDERNMSVDDQLRSLRSGYTAAGGAGAGLGSLASGGGAYSTSSRRRDGDVYESYRRNIEDTGVDERDDGPVVAEVEARRRAPDDARRRSLAAGSASRYYRRRFG